MTWGSISSCTRVIVLLAAARAMAAAQPVSSQVSVSAGSATDERGVRATALTVAPSVALAPATGTDILFGGNATRFDNSGWQVGGGAAFATRTASAGGFALSLGAGASV